MEELYDEAPKSNAKTRLSEKSRAGGVILEFLSERDDSRAIGVGLHGGKFTDPRISERKQRISGFQFWNNAWWIVQDVYHFTVPLSSRIVTCNSRNFFENDEYSGFCVVMHSYDSSWILMKSPMIRQKMWVLLRGKNWNDMPS